MFWNRAGPDLTSNRPRLPTARLLYGVYGRAEKSFIDSSWPLWPDLTGEMRTWAAPDL